jgi:predicted alpha/beta-hydrolase family hydrolase
LTDTWPNLQTRPIARPQLHGPPWQFGCEVVPTDFLITEPPRPGHGPIARFLCAHGAGGGMQTAFLTHMAALLAERGIATHRFAFAYMARHEAGPRRPPRAEHLIDEYRAAAAAMPAGAPLLIGGKSMGGRVASLVADELYACGRIAGLVCLGYPFHPPNKPEQLRTRHLLQLACPALIVQGERDPFGTRAEVEALRLSPSIRIAWMRDGDHDLRARRVHKLRHLDSLAAAADAVAAFGLCLNRSCNKTGI